MITIKPASELQIGDVFSTDGFAVESARPLADGRISVSLWLDASGGVSKHAVLAADQECPIWTPDADPSKLMYTIGNLYTGYPWGVAAEREFGTVDYFGPFKGQNEANTFAHRLVQDEQGQPLAFADSPYVTVKVVRLETPQVGSAIVRKDGKLSYDQRDALITEALGIAPGETKRIECVEIDHDTGEPLGS